jgi:4-alpha-glucanotransferase
VSEENVSDQFISMAMGSVADICIIPMQDLLGLGSEARMNNPGVSTGNWRWRALTSEFSDDLFQRLAETTVSNGRG